MIHLRKVTYQFEERSMVIGARLGYKNVTRKEVENIDDLSINFIGEKNNFEIEMFLKVSFGALRRFLAGKWIKNDIAISHDEIFQ